MNPAHRCIDAQGLPCPQPVILARKALAEGGFETLEILVDDAASRENLLKFAAYAQCDVDVVDTGANCSRILMHPRGTPGPVASPASVPAGLGASGATVLIATDGIGQGDPDLAKLLMRGFLYTLTECEAPPMRIILMNAGVRLAVTGSDTLDHLRKVGDRGVDILACGTCLEFYKLTEALGVGRITNMYEIAGLLLEGPALTL